MLDVKEIVATPLAFVVLVGVAKEPPLELLHVTTMPACKTELLLASESCAVMVTDVPATGLLPLDVTRYFEADPTTAVIFPLVPVTALPSVPVTVYTIPAGAFVVNVTVAAPLPFVVLVGLEKFPPLVLVQLTTRPAVLTALLLLSAI